MMNFAPVEITVYPIGNELVLPSTSSHSIISLKCHKKNTIYEVKCAIKEKLSSSANGVHITNPNSIILFSSNNEVIENPVVRIQTLINKASRLNNNNLVLKMSLDSAHEENAPPVENCSLKLPIHCIVYDIANNKNDCSIVNKSLDDNFLVFLSEISNHYSVENMISYINNHEVIAVDKTFKEILEIDTIPPFQIFVSVRIINLTFRHFSKSDSLLDLSKVNFSTQLYRPINNVLECIKDYTLQNNPAITELDINDIELIHQGVHIRSYATLRDALQFPKVCSLSAQDASFRKTDIHVRLTTEYKIAHGLLPKDYDPLKEESIWQQIKNGKAFEFFPKPEEIPWTDDDENSSLSEYSLSESSDSENDDGLNGLDRNNGIPGFSSKLLDITLGNRKITLSESQAVISTTIDNKSVLLVNPSGLKELNKIGINLKKPSTTSEIPIPTPTINVITQNHGSGAQNNGNINTNNNNNNVDIDNINDMNNDGDNNNSDSSINVVDNNLGGNDNNNNNNIVIVNNVDDNNNNGIDNDNNNNNDNENDEVMRFYRILQYLFIILTFFYQIEGSTSYKLIFLLIGSCMFLIYNNRPASIMTSVTTMIFNIEEIAINDFISNVRNTYNSKVESLIDFCCQDRIIFRYDKFLDSAYMSLEFEQQLEPEQEEESEERQRLLRDYSARLFIKLRYKELRSAQIAYVPDILFFRSVYLLVADFLKDSILVLLLMIPFAEGRINYKLISNETAFRKQTIEIYKEALESLDRIKAEDLDQNNGSSEHNTNNDENHENDNVGFASTSSQHVDLISSNLRNRNATSTSEES